MPHKIERASNNYTLRRCELEGKRLYRAFQIGRRARIGKARFRKVITEFRRRHHRRVDLPVDRRDGARQIGEFQVKGVRFFFALEAGDDMKGLFRPPCLCLLYQHFGAAVVVRAIDP